MLVVIVVVNLVKVGCVDNPMNDREILMYNRNSESKSGGGSCMQVAEEWFSMAITTDCRGVFKILVCGKEILQPLHYY